ncbi:hypothetical protein JPH1_54130 (plasmid) [Mycobacterium avium subsp. hominissuis]|uniref:Uncharacterized protein n=1 Tax=Mycobacterium avium subsp. hominissuis TaxID=439334 RepID=A0AAI8STC2_MYCAV|nr:hypothetical protein JPH1_54130 [Mycobacterium avium subsp. hominissuis]
MDHSYPLRAPWLGPPGGAARLEHHTVNIYTALAIVGVVAVLGYYCTAAFIVAKTGSTAGITDLGKGAARILGALVNHNANKD